MATFSANIYLSVNNVHELVALAVALEGFNFEDHEVELVSPGAGAIGSTSVAAEAEPPTQAPQRRTRKPKDAATEPASITDMVQQANQEADEDAAAALLMGDVGAGSDGTPAVTLDDVKNAMREVIKAKGSVAVANVFATVGKGAASVSDIPPELYGAVHAALKATVA